MYKPKKYFRLEAINIVPRISDCKKVLAEAQKNRGATVELPWRSQVTQNPFSLTVKIDIGSSEPIWTLYEGEGSNSRVVWSSPFEDLELMNDVLCLSLPGETPQSGLTQPAEVALAEPHDNDRFSRRSAEYQPSTPPPEGPMFYEATPQPVASETPVWQREDEVRTIESLNPPQPQSPYYQQQAPVQQPQPNPYPPYPPAPGYPPYPPYPQGYYPPYPPMPGYPPYPPMPGYPPYPPAYVDPNTQMPYPYPPMPQAYPYAGPQPAAGGLHVAGNSAAHPAMAPQATPTPTAEAAPPLEQELPPPAPMRVDSELINKRPNILLGHFLVESGLIPDSTLDAALQLQDMVKSGSLKPELAAEAVRRAHNRGGKVDSTTFTATTPPVQFKEHEIVAPPLGQILVDAGLISIGILKAALNLQEVVRTGALSKEDAVDAFITEHFGKGGKYGSRGTQKSLDLLKKAGLLQEQDVQAALNVRKRHGGEVAKILVAAGKIDKITLEAAAKCQTLIEDGRLKVEQAIIALHYCQRSRVSFDEAVEELGWEKP